MGDRINSQSVANAIVDWALHSGTKTAVRSVLQHFTLQIKQGGNPDY